MLSEEEFIILFLEADKQTQEQVEIILNNEKIDKTSARQQ